MSEAGDTRRRRRWRVETAANGGGGPQYLEAVLQRIELEDGDVLTVLTNPGPYLSWTVVWSRQEEEQ
jgi:hypothetical protein